MRETFELQSETHQASDDIFSNVKTRHFMGRVNDFLPRDHQLPETSAVVASAVIGNLIVDARAKGDVQEEYIGWSVHDEITNVPIARTNDERIHVDLAPITHIDRQENTRNARRFAKLIFDADQRTRELGIESEIKHKEQQDFEIQDRINNLAGAMGSANALGTMLLLEAVQTTEAVNTARLTQLVEGAVRALSVKLYNQQVRTQNGRIVELLVAYDQVVQAPVPPTKLLGDYKRLYPEETFESPLATYVRLREILMQGVEELYATAR